jgi:hypothetical protein
MVNIFIKISESSLHIIPLCYGVSAKNLGGGAIDQKGGDNGLAHTFNLGMGGLNAGAWNPAEPGNYAV